LEHLQIDSVVEVWGANGNDLTAVAALAPRLPHLKSFEYKVFNYISSAGVTALAHHCPNLSDVAISWANHVNENSLLELARCLNLRLRRLCLSGAVNLTNANIAAIARFCPTIERLALRGVGAGVTSEAYGLLKGCLSLKVLSLQVPINENSAIAIAEHCPNLEVLIFTGSSDVYTDTYTSEDRVAFNDAAVCILLERCANLRELKNLKRSC
jgi:hypothetical protein